MARGLNLADLAALTDDATLVAGQDITATEPNAHRRKVNSMLNNLLTGLRDKESAYAGSGAPIGKKQGKAYFDTATSLWMGYKTNAGVPLALLDSMHAYARELATAGTGTFKLGGPVSIDITQHVVAALGTNTLYYSVPANTLNSNGSLVSLVMFLSAAIGSHAKKITFGSTTILDDGGGPPSVGVIKALSIRSSAGSQKCFALIRGSVDNAGTGTSGVTSSAEDETSAINFGLLVTGTGSATIDCAAWKYGES